MVLLILIFAFLLSCPSQALRLESKNEPKQNVPFYEVKGKTLYEVGVQQGKLAGKRIKAWSESEEMQKLDAFCRGEGHALFNQMIKENTAVFPQYVEELKGVSDGSGVSMDWLWKFNLISELESLMKINISKVDDQFQHCSDFYAISPMGYNAGFAHGHNEDWSSTVMKEFYMLKIKALPGANFRSCAGQAYPGTLVGWAASWNDQGMYLTQNSLYPLRKFQQRKDYGRGLSSAFIQRDALCGFNSKVDNLDDVIATMTKKYLWNYGASINIVDMNNKRMASVETFFDIFDVFEVLEKHGNYSHFNMYKHLKPGLVDTPGPSTVHRQARADALPNVIDAHDIRVRLSDTADKIYPIYRTATIGTFVLNGLTGQYDIWCCGVSSHSGVPPVYSFNLKTFFDD